MSPILAILFLNSLGDGLRARMSQFADDTTLYSVAPTVDGQLLELQHDLALIQKWCDRWRVDLKPSKCRHMLFDRRQKRARRATRAQVANQLVLPGPQGDVVILTEDRYKLLGVVFTPDL